jgi:alkylation response protein AidB-like acyl-CoA dehydrogenase
MFGKTKYGSELCYEAKIYGSESAAESRTDVINLVGVSAYSRDSPLGHLLQDALVLPVFDGESVGVRRRQIEKIFTRMTMIRGKQRMALSQSTTNGK